MKTKEQWIQALDGLKPRVSDFGNPKTEHIVAELQTILDKWWVNARQPFIDFVETLLEENTSLK